MEFNKAFDEKQNKLLDDQSRGPGIYQMDNSLKTNKPAYPWAPGSSTSRSDQAPAPDLVDIQSDLRNLDRFMPHTDQQAGKLNIFIMLKGQTAVTNGIVFYTDNNLDMHVGFRENRAVMFPSLKMHSPHLNEEPNKKRYTATLFVKDYELK